MEMPLLVMHLQMQLLHGYIRYYLLVSYVHIQRYKMYIVIVHQVINKGDKFLRMRCRAGRRSK